MAAVAAMGAKGCPFTDDVSLGDGQNPGGKSGTDDAGGMNGAGAPDTSLGLAGEEGNEPSPGTGGASPMGGSNTGGHAAGASSLSSGGATSSGGRAAEGGASVTSGGSGSAGVAAGGGGNAAAGNPGMAGGTAGPSDFEPPPECLLPLASGNCPGQYTAYGYDARQERCVAFESTDCAAPGNPNWFKSLLECQWQCEPPAPVVDPCTLPVDPGPCEANIPRFAYDASAGTCVQFSYGGCDGNTNNWAEYDSCAIACVEFTEQTCPLSLVKARGYRYDAERDCVSGTDTYLDCVGLFGVERVERGCMRRLSDAAIFASVNTEMSLEEYAACTAAEQELVDTAPQCAD